MKRLFTIAILVLFSWGCVLAQKPEYNGKKYSAQVVSVNGNLKTGYVAIKIRLKSNIQASSATVSSSIYTMSVCAWDADGNFYVANGKSKSFNVSQDVYVNMNLDNIFLELPTTLSTLRTLRIGVVLDNGWLSEEHAETMVFHDVPVTWKDEVKLPTTFTKTVEGYFNSKGSTAVNPVPEDKINYYVDNGDFQGYVVAAIGNRMDNKVKVICRVKTSAPGKEYYQKGTFLYRMATLRTEEGIFVWDMDPRTKSDVAANEWSDVVLDYELPTNISKINEMVVRLSQNDNTYGGHVYEQFIVVAKDIPIQWVDVPIKPKVSPETLLSMVGKNSVGPIKLGMKLDQIPARVEGMYDEVVKEKGVYCESCNTGYRVSFRYEGEEVMYGFTYNKKNRNVNTLQRLVIEHVGGPTFIEMKK
jgi:hypothetical protein